MADVGEQWMAAKPLGEHALAGSNRLLGIHFVESGVAP